MKPEHDDEIVRAMYLAGQRRWTLFTLPFEAFQRHLESVRTETQTGSLQAADLYLSCACALAHPEALRLFECETSHVAEAAIRRVDGDDEFVRDSLQELWNRLLLGNRAKVRSYSGRGPLQAWVRVAATRVALDRRRADRRHGRREVELSEQLADSETSPEAVELKTRFGAAFQTALRGSLSRLSEQDRNVLRMHVVGRCSIDEIGVAYDVHRATAARWIERARGAIYDDVQRELCGQHKLTISEFRSLATMLGAELELSFGLGHLSTQDRGPVGLQ